MKSFDEYMIDFNSLTGKIEKGTSRFINDIITFIS
jgi:hypothetical protein